MRQLAQLGKILDAKAANGVGTGKLVQDYLHIVLALDTASNANLTVKFQASMADVEPAWGSAQSVANQWDYVQVKDLEDGAAIDGDTGIAPAGTDDHRQLEVNVNGIRWLNAIVSGYAAGSITLRAVGFTSNE